MPPTDLKFTDGREQVANQCHQEMDPQEVGNGEGMQGGGQGEQRNEELRFILLSLRYQQVV